MVFSTKSTIRIVTWHGLHLSTAFTEYSRGGGIAAGLSSDGLQADDLLIANIDKRRKVDLGYFEQALNLLWIPAYPVKINKHHHINSILYNVSDEVSKFHTFVLRGCLCVLKSENYKEYMVTVLQAVGFTPTDLPENFYEFYEPANGENKRSDEIQGFAALYRPGRIGPIYFYSSSRSFLLEHLVSLSVRNEL